MNIFALDSSSKTACVAIMQNGSLLYESYLANGLTHSETLMQLVQSAFEATGLKPEDIELFAVNAGPGSFTGLRIGMALIKGIAMPNNTPCTGVSTLESMAHTFCGQGRVICSLNARRGEVYFAAFDVNEGKVERLCPDMAGDATLTKQYATNGVYLMGDGCDIVQNALQQEFTSILYNANFINGRAVGVAICGENQAKCSAKELSVNYHRLSQAQRQREEKENNNE